PPLAKTRRHRRRGPIILAVAAVLVVLMALAAFWVERQIHGHAHGGPIAVTIPKGASTSSIGSLLHAKGVIGNTLVWRLYATVKRPGPLQSGDFRFRHDENMGHVL